MRMVDGELRPVTGALYGPLIFPQMLERPAASSGTAAARRVDCVRRHSHADQVQQALAAGARAVQIDSAVWVEPGLPGRLAASV